MSESKKLIIGADVAGVEKQFKNVKKMLADLNKEGIRVSQTLKGFSLEKSHGLGAFAKSIAFSSQKMKDFRGITEDTAKVMKGIWSKTLQQEQGSLDRTAKQLERLNKLRKEQAGLLSTAKMHGGSGERYQGNVGRLDEMIASKVAERISRQDAIKDLKAPAFGGINWAGINQGMGLGRALSGAIGGFAGAYQQTKTLQDENLAGIRSYERSMLGKMMSGDFSDLYFMGQRKRGKSIGDHAFGRFGGTGAASLKYSTDAVSGILDVGLAAGRMRGIPGGGGGGSLPTNDISNLSGAASQVGAGVTGSYMGFKNRLAGGPEADEARTMMAGQSMIAPQSPMEQAAFQFMQSTAPMRVHAAKSLQGRHMGAWGIGRGFGLDMGESMSAAAQLARGAGVSATMGGQRYVPGDMGNALSLAASLTGGAGSFDNYQRRQGGMGEMASMTRNGRYVSDGPSLLGQTLGLESRGMDRGAAGQMMTQMMFSTGGNMSKSGGAMEKVLSKAFSVGLKDARLGEEIGRATAEASIGAGGRLSDSAAVGMALSGGLSGRSTLFDVQQNIAGGQAFNQRMNGNSFFNAVKIEAGKNILGDSGTHTQMLALQKASWEDLVGGSRQLGVAGIKEPQRRALLNTMASSGLSTYLERGDPAMKDLQAAADSGDFIGALKKSRGKGGNFEQIMEQYGTLMSTRTGVSQETAEGELRLLAGFGDKTAGTGTYGRNRDGTAEATVQMQQEVLSKLYEKEIKMRDHYLEQLQLAPELVDTIDKNNTDFQSFQRFMKEFLKLIEDLYRKNHVLPPQGAQRGR